MLGYDEAGDLETIDRYAGATASPLVAHTQFTMDTQRRLSELEHSGTSSTPLATYSWSFDASNRIDGVTSSVDFSVDYTYDDTDQLTSAVYTAVSGAPLPAPANESYTYDANGNRTGSGYVQLSNNRGGLARPSL